MLLSSIAIACLIGSAANTQTVVMAEEAALAASSRQGLAALRHDSTSRVSLVLDVETRQPRYASFTREAPVWLGVDRSRIASWALSRYAELFDRAALSQLERPVFYGVEGGLETALFLQSVAGLYVEGGAVLVHFVRGKQGVTVVGIDNRTVPGLSLDIDAILAKAIELEQALAHIASTTVAGVRFSKPTIVETDLVIAPRPDKSALGERAVVCHRVVAKSGERTYLFHVDAASGEVLRFSNYVRSYGRRVQVSDGHGTENSDFWELAYANVSSDPSNARWSSFDEYHAPYDASWFYALPTHRRSLIDTPHAYHRFLRRYGHDGVNSTDEAFVPHLVYASRLNLNAGAYGGSGLMVFHRELSVPDGIVHEMTHYLLNAKDLPYPADDLTASSAIHEGMGDIQAELITRRYFGQGDWLMGTGMAVEFGFPIRDLVTEPSSQECWAWDPARMLVAPSPDHVTLGECYDAERWLNPDSEFPSSTPYDPVRHGVCITALKHFFPCPHHIAYNEDLHVYDVAAYRADGRDGHECYNLEGVIVDCPAGLPHAFAGGEAPVDRTLYECHNWGNLLGHVGYLLASELPVENNGVYVEGIGADRLEDVFVPAMFGLGEPFVSEFEPGNALERRWVEEGARPGQWERDWSDLCEGMVQSCERLTSIDGSDLEPEHCDRIERVFASVGACDFDADGVPNGQDNCPYVWNPGQENGDGRMVTECEMSLTTGEIRCELVFPSDPQGDACDVCPDQVGVDEWGCPLINAQEPYKEWDPGLGIIAPDREVIINTDSAVVETENGLDILERKLGGSQVTASFYKGQDVTKLIAHDARVLVGLEDKVAVLDASSPAQPFVSAELALEQPLVELLVVRGLAASPQLIVAAGRTVAFYSLAVPAKPRLTHTVALPDRVVDVAWRDDRLYVATELGLSCVALSAKEDALTGVLSSSMKLAGITQVEAARGLALLMTKGQLVVVDVAKLESPAVTDILDLEVSGARMTVREGRIEIE